MKKIIDLVESLAIHDGYNPTHIPEIGIFKNCKAQSRVPFFYQQSIILCVQGEKNIYLENKVYTYNKDNYLVVTVPLPLECEVILEKDKPLFAIILGINIQTLNKIIYLMGKSIDFNKLNRRQKDIGLYTAAVTPDFLEIIYRLLKSLQTVEDTNILGQGIYQELLYFLLKDKESAPLYALTMKNTNLAKIEMALKEIHRNFSNTIQVDDLANLVSMSTSSFHHAFKEVTATSPIQYIKKIRLDKARNFMVQNRMQVNEVAREVGYESVSQFSREFKRYYGVPPKNFIQN